MEMQQDINMECTKKKMYSPAQVACGALGGPVGVIYFLRENFTTLGNEVFKTKTLHFGIMFILALIVVLPLLPESMPSTPFTVLYILIGKFSCEKFQMKKNDISESEEYTFHSNWRVFGIGIVCTIASVLVIMFPLYILAYHGVI